MHADRIPKSWNGPVSPAAAPPGQPVASAATARGKAGDSGRGVAAQVRVRLTGRGGILAVFAISFIGLLAASLSHAGALAGFSYVVACFLAAFLVRRGHLLSVAVTAPMLFGGAVVCVQAMTAAGGLLSVAGGTLVTLGNVAPWLFAGTALAVIIALARGLAGELRALHASVRGETRS